MDSDKWTDEALERLEKRISEAYDEASKELGAKAQDYFLKYDERFKKEELAMLTSSLPKEEIEDRWLKLYGNTTRFESWFRTADHAYGATKEQAEQKFKAWEYAQLGRGQHWYDMRDQMAQRLTETNKIAEGYINDVLPKVYVANNNAVADIAKESAMKEGVTGIRFDLADEYTVRKLMMESSDVRPYKPVNISMDESTRWSKNKLQNALLQGILQGDSIDHIADRFQTVTNMNRASAIRNARTATTGAQSAGKQDRYDDLAKQGCIFSKIWVATEDERTREEHAEADGQEVDYDLPFDVGGEELMYPADPNGSGWNIYNCRCTMKTGKPRFVSILSDRDKEEAFDDNKINENNEAKQSVEVSAKTDAEMAVKWADNLTEEQKEAVTWYVAGDGMEANNYLRQRGYYAGGAEADDFLKDQIKQLDDAIESYGGLKENGTYYRSVDASAFFNKAQIREMNDFAYGFNNGENIKSVIGKEVTDKGFLSTTTDKELVEDWGDFTGSENPIIVQYDVPKGAKGANLKAFDIEGDEQNETLFARNSKVEITDVEVNEYHMIVVKARMKK